MGRRSLTECLIFPSFVASLRDIAAWRTWSSGEVGKRDVAMVARGSLLYRCVVVDLLLCTCTGTWNAHAQDAYISKATTAIDVGILYTIC